MADDQYAANPSSADRPSRRFSSWGTALLTADEERMLAAQIRAGGEAAEVARERFVAANQPLVFKLARKRARPAGLSLEDLVQEGNVGLLRAIAAFDPQKGRFSTYSTLWIRQAISRAVENNGGSI